MTSIESTQDFFFYVSSKIGNNVRYTKLIKNVTFLKIIWRMESLFISFFFSPIYSCGVNSVHLFEF